MKASVLTKETILDLNTVDRKFPDFRVGDSIEIAQIVKEGSKERLQMFAGDVIAFHNKGISTTFTIRKIGANGIGVERIFPYYSPIIDSIKVLKRGKVRRAKLFYVRKLIGKAARLKERILTKEQKLKQSAKAKKAEKKEDA
jgi:large subunit ribosomal protein L19